MKKKTGMSVSIGSSTMLLIFVVISLVSFSVLSLSSAITDKKFTEKIKQKNSVGYQTKEICGKLLMECVSEEINSGTEKDYFLKKKVDNTMNVTLTLTVDIVTINASFILTMV